MSTSDIRVNILHTHNFGSRFYTFGSPLSIEAHTTVNPNGNVTFLGVSKHLHVLQASRDVSVGDDRYHVAKNTANAGR